MKKYCFSIILGLVTGISVLAQFEAKGITDDSFVTGVRPVTVPVANPEADRFFGNELQNAFIRGQSTLFTFICLYADMFQVPDNLVAPDSRNKDNRVIRFSTAAGGMLPIGDYLSVMGGFGVVRDNIYIAQSWNMFIGAGVFGFYVPWGIGLGIMGGYYQNRYEELTLEDDGFYHGKLDQQQETTSRAARFMIIPRLSLSDKVFFLDELTANVGFSEKADVIKILSRLAFSVIQIGAAKLGIDVYYNQYKYNMILDQRLYGAKFDSKYVSFDIGYRQFLNTDNNPFVSNYKDGMFGRVIAKIWILDNKKYPLLLSYGFEQTFEMSHFFGIGLQVGSGWMTMDSIMEFDTIGDMRWGAVMPFF